MLCPECGSGSYSLFAGCADCGYRRGYWNTYTSHEHPSIPEQVQHEPGQISFREMLHFLQGAS